MLSELAKADELISNQKYEEAASLYAQCIGKLEKNDKSRITCYQNGGSAYRRSNNLKEALSLLKKGVEEFPNAAGIHHNLGNCLRDDEKPWEALKHFLTAGELGLKNQNLVVSTAKLLMDQAFLNTAYAVIEKWLSEEGAKEQPSADLYVALLELTGAILNDEETQKIGEWCVNNLGEIAKDNITGQAGLATFKARLGQTKEASEWFEKSKESLLKKWNNDIASSTDNEQENKFQTIRNAEQSIINAGWNLSCALLKEGEMKTGWELFDYGLQAPASGKQRWQRALMKPCSGEALKLWEGEDPKGLSILVLGEQAVGDTLMFMQLIDCLIRAGAKIGIMVQHRLKPIYERSFPELTVYDEAAEDLEEINFADYDYQIPCGSLPQYLMKDWLNNSWFTRKPLQVNENEAKLLKASYREEMEENDLLIGISWVGGGKGGRIRNKSMPTDLFQQCLETERKVRFLSLQYGNANSQIETWKHYGIDVIHDSTVDALKNMDRWMSQVECCDAVLSVANTTIHGAGLLNKPTLCLQSKNSDWRWIKNLERSYWYPTVEAQLQSKHGDWENTITDAKDWIENVQKTNNLSEIDKNRILESILNKANFE